MNQTQTNFLYSRKLSSLWQLHNQTESMINLDFTPTSKPNKQLSKQKIQYLHQTINKIKVNNLVHQFVYKIRRNIAKNTPIQYDKIQQILAEKKKQLKFLKPFNINDSVKATFMILNIVCILIIQTLSTFQGFQLLYRLSDSKNKTVMIIQLFCLIVFILKLLMGLTTPRITSKIRHIYLRHTIMDYVLSILFVFDFFNFIMTLVKIILPQSSLVGIICFAITFLSLPFLAKDLQIIQTIWVDNFKKKQYFSIGKILIFNLFFAQFISALILSASFYDAQNNWITKAIDNGNMNPQLNWWQLYFYALYFAIATLTTTGFGDLTPANFFQVIIVTLCMLLGTVVLSYNVTSIGKIMENLRSINQKRKQETVIFKRMSVDQNISPELEDKILDYIYKSSQIRSQFQFNQRKSFLEKLPPQLRDEFQSQYAKNIFSKVPFFKLLQPKTQIKFSLKLKGQIYYPGEQMLRTNGRLSKILFLKHGKIGFTYNKKGSILNGLTLQSRQIFRSNNNPYLLNKYLLTQQKRMNYQIIAQSYCFMLILEYDDFYQILRDNKHDNQFYFYLSNRISFIDKEWDMFECSYCKPKRHCIFLCPKLHYMPYKSIIIQKYIFSPLVPQKRRERFNRKQSKIKGKNPLRFWKHYFKYYQQKYQNTYDRVDEKRNKNQLQQQQKISTLDQDDFIFHQIQSQNKSYTQSQNLSKVHELAIMISQKVLNAHCCQLYEVYSRQNELQFDTMHDFFNFFPEFNPTTLIQKPLKQRKTRIKRTRQE